MYDAWKVLGWKPKDFDHLMEMSGFPVPRRTFNHWSSTSVEEEVGSSSPKKRGRPALLDDAGADVLVGYCLCQVSKGESVHLETVVDFCRTSLHVDISHPTASRILEQCGFSSRIS